MFSDDLLIKLPQRRVGPDSPIHNAALSVLLARACGGPATIVLSSPSGDIPQVLAAGDTRLMCARSGEWRVESGEADVTVLNEVFFVKLLSFLDEARNLSSAQDPDNSPFLNLPVDLALDSDRRHIEFWFLGRTLENDRALDPFLALLRRTEAYWLVRYLITASDKLAGASLGELGEQYGLSYSHFRRICKQALGNNAKSELKGWRIARSLLEVVEHRMTLTDVALKYGYASSSHFSTEIKNRLGVSPRSLTDITSLPLDSTQ
ncbi:AraC family transcriptional regulator [Paludibacterium paludis]|uniref:HTH araC/xylS-type domain-containing protein n=1 Tax=Paludibacterium paludis TaxID=1225769 RepID=A0A918P5M4_9NEIS|nr:AraC family transcriptional regulator [Paludibacterium paludis]GGY24035.1 hypothetical protein GCM10011289_29710 [Paludibacterium paludis]